MPVRKRELMFDMRRLLGVGNFARVAEYFNRVGGFVVLILRASTSRFGLR